jgi:ATP-dependent DNA helicase RecG
VGSIADVAFVLPERWADYRHRIQHFRELDALNPGTPVVIEGWLKGTPQTRMGRPIRTLFTLTDPEGERASAIAFGDTREMQKSLTAVTGRVAIAGAYNPFGEQRWVKNIEPVDAYWLGRLRPVYPGKAGGIGRARVAHLLDSWLERAIPAAVSELSDLTGLTPQALAAAVGRRGEALEAVFWQAHRPADPSSGERAQAAVERLGVYRTVEKTREERRAAAPRVAVSAAHARHDWRDRLSALPFRLTDEQYRAVDEIITDMQSGQAMHRMLCGDVGSGKTVVFALAAAWVIDTGGRAGVMVPSEVLVGQIAANIRAWWPDIGASMVAVTSTSGEAQAMDSARLYVGTTALLARKHPAIDLMIIDEQHRFSRDQREAIARASEGHLLEATATCIPRSAALVSYGNQPVTRLPTAHVEKAISTRYIPPEQRRALFEHIRTVMELGHQVLVIYPRRGDSNAAQNADLMDVERAVERWEKIAPGAVAKASGSQSEAQNREAIERMKRKQARILVATTVVEVGVDIPDIRVALIVHPERFGLATLHQLRGRLARAGGEGQFLLFSPHEVPETTRARMQILETTTDGFELAQQDLQLRGFGDIRRDGVSQSGSAMRIVFGRELTPERIDSAIREYAQMREN